MRRQLPVVAIISLLAIPLGTASAEILYVTNFVNTHITVINTETDSVTTIPLVNNEGIPLRPRCIDFTPDGTKAYVSTDDGGGASDVVVIDTATQMIDKFLLLSPGGHNCVAVSPNVDRAYLSNVIGGKIAVIDTADNTPLPFVIDAQPPGFGNFQANRLLLSPDGSTLYALISNGALAAQIEGADTVPQVAKAITFSGNVNAIVSDFDITQVGPVGPDELVGNRLYVTMEGGGDTIGETLQVFDTNKASPNQVDIIELGKGLTSTFGAGGVAITPDGQFAYVVVPADNRVEVIRIADIEDSANTNPIIATIVVGIFPVQIAFSSDGAFAYVTNNGSRTITVINTSSNTVDRTINAETENDEADPYLIAILPSVPSETASLDHFLCYKAKGRKVKNVRVDLEDQFGFEERVKVKKPKVFCNPVAKTHDGMFTEISDVTAHLTGYKIEDRDDEVKRRVLVENQFGPEQRLRMEEPELLLVPSEMNGVLSTLNLDYFLCYEAKGRKVNVRVDLLDQFEFQGQVKVKKPKLFCNPVVVKNGMFPVPDALINPEAHLTCYDIDDEEKVKLRVVVDNQFGLAQELKVKKPKLLCVPSTKEDLEDPVRDRDDDDDDDDDDDHKKEEKEKDDD